MTQEQIKQKITTIICEALEIEEVLFEQLERESLPKWDSLKQLEIVMNIEEEFDVRFTPGEIADIDGAKYIFKSILEKGIFNG